MQRVITNQSLKSGKTTKAIQDGSREFVTVLACCSVGGISIEPTLIYAGKSRDLQDTWVEKLEEGDKVVFGTSETGWTYNQYSLL